MTPTLDPTHGSMCGSACLPPAPRASFPEAVDLTEGLPVPLATPDGQQLMGSIRRLNEETVTIDLNHPLAGKSLQFDIELVAIGDDESGEPEANENS